MIIFFNGLKLIKSLVMDQKDNNILGNGSKRQSYPWEWIKETIISLRMDQRDNHIFGNG